MTSSVLCSAGPSSGRKLSPNRPSSSSPRPKKRLPAPKKNTTKTHLNSELQCPHFDVCSGCSLQNNLQSPPILHRAAAFFSHLGYQDFSLHSDGQQLQGWRHRARLAVRTDSTNGQPCVGLFEAGTHSAVDIPHCTVHHPDLNTAADLIRSCMHTCNVQPYDEATGAGHLRYIQLAIVDASDEDEDGNYLHHHSSKSAPGQRKTTQVQIVLVWNADSLETAAPELVQFAAAVWAEAGRKKDDGNHQFSRLLHSLHVNFHSARNNTILSYDSSATVLLHGSPDAWTHLNIVSETKNNENDSCTTVQIAFDPGSFLQANPGAMAAAVSELRKWIAPVQGGARVVDLHAGIGTIGVSVAATCDIAALRAVEINPSSETVFWKSWRRLVGGVPSDSVDGSSIGEEKVKMSNDDDDVRQKGIARLSACEAEYFVAAAGSAPEKWLHGADVVIVDPPRKGLESTLLHYFCGVVVDDDDDDHGGERKPLPQRILYLSCGWPAFEKDCSALLESGRWQLRWARAFLFFPGADHIETLAVFDNISSSCASSARVD